jgi:type I restriction enzyme M protein
MNASTLHTLSDILRGDYKRGEMGKVILPFIVLRRLECCGIVKNYSLKECLKDPRNDLLAYIRGISLDIVDIFEQFEFDREIEKLNKLNILPLMIDKMASIDLSEAIVNNADMGSIFEELIRQFAEDSHETSGEHYTPREVIRLLVDILFIDDKDQGGIRTIYDPTAGTGGMLSVADDYLKVNRPDIKLIIHSQELNGESYAIFKSDMLIKGYDTSRIKLGNTLSNDQHERAKFDYCISNPPYGVDWKKIEKVIRLEHETQGFNGRFGAGLPRVSDGSLLFLQHLISKMKAPEDGGSRIAIVLNGSPLYTGGAGSGESDIRKYIVENDLLEAIIGLPNDLFYNTGISTYIWVLTNKKSIERKNKVQLINAVDMYVKMRKSLGSKRNELSQNNIDMIMAMYRDFKECKNSKIFNNTDFGYSTITVERPLRDEHGNKVLMTKGKLKGSIQPDVNLRDTENIPLSDDIDEYFNREVLPHTPDAWINHEKTKVGYEFSFNRYFYEHVPLRSLDDIKKEMKQLSKEIFELMNDIFDDIDVIDDNLVIPPHKES